MILLVVRAQSHTQIHEHDRITHPAFEACALERAAPRRRANPARRQVPSTHSPCAETIVCRLCFGPLGELEAVVGVIPEDLGLFHQHELGTEPTRRNRPYRIVTSAELSTAVRHWTSMRILLAMVLAFISTAPLADSTGERRPTGSTPTATETISDLYTFSRFQQGLLESTDLKGNAEVKNPPPCAPKKQPGATRP